MQKRYLERLETKKQEAEVKAWESLARYKFVMFGYWAGVYLHLQRLSGKRERNPFAILVNLARAKGYGPKGKE